MAMGGNVKAKWYVILSTWNNFILKSEQGGYIWSTALSVCSAFDPNGTGLVGEILSQGIWWQWIFALIKIWSAWNFVRHLNWGRRRDLNWAAPDFWRNQTIRCWRLIQAEVRGIMKFEIVYQNYTKRASIIVLTKSKKCEILRNSDFGGWSKLWSVKSCSMEIKIAYFGYWIHIPGNSTNIF